MPELPEVETVRRSLEPLIIERRILCVDARAFPGVMGPIEIAHAALALTGRKLEALRRRGKYLIIDLDDDTALLVHLRMTGLLVAASPDTPLIRHEHLSIMLSPHEATGSAQHPQADFQSSERITLRFADQRKFGRVLHVQQSSLDELSFRLGPEPLGPEFTVAALSAALHGRSAPIKSVLLDQRRVAGLGNIYVDEALFRARVHPLQPAGSIGPAAVKRLRAEIIAVLSEGIANRGTTFSSFRDGIGDYGANSSNLRVYGRGRRGEPCDRCTRPLASLKVSGRTSHYCPNCQRLR